MSEDEKISSSKNESIDLNEYNSIENVAPISDEQHLLGIIILYYIIIK